MQVMEAPVRWSIADLELLPDNGTCYEIVDGELFMSKQPHWHHQNTCGNIYEVLQNWSRETGHGRASLAPGLIFDDTNDVAPDVVWVSDERLEAILGEDGHLHGAPELVVEVLSPGTKNERRDREAKLKLYSLRGVQEYWIANWQLQTVEVYRRQGVAPRLVGTWQVGDELTSPLLPGFAVRVADLFR
jgi:Uma2 family endonuclease